MKLGDTLQLGPYTVRAMMRADNPAFPCYLVFRGDALIGKQFSVPCESDCRWHEMRRGQYAKAEESKQDARWQLKILPHKRIGRTGRPRKADAERELAEALAS